MHTVGGNTDVDFSCFIGQVAAIDLLVQSVFFVGQRLGVVVTAFGYLGDTKLVIVKGVASIQLGVAIFFGVKSGKLKIFKTYGKSGTTHKS